MYRRLVKTSIIPCFRYQNCGRAISWLCTAFDFEKHLIVPGIGDNILHAELAYGNALIILASASSSTNGPFKLNTSSVNPDVYDTASIYMVIEDVDDHYEKSKAAGAEITMELSDQEYGGRGYSCIDLEGYLWSFGSYDPWK